LATGPEILNATTLKTNHLEITPMSLPQDTMDLLREIEETVDTYRGYL